MMGHRAKFRGKSKCFVHDLFPVPAILRCFFTSGTLHERLLLEISIHTAAACILAMSCVGYAHVRLKTLSSRVFWNMICLESINAKRQIKACICYNTAIQCHWIVGKIAK